MHYSDCVALTGDIERVFGVRVPDIAGEVLPALPTTEMPHSLFAFKQALRQMAEDNCLPFGVRAIDAKVVRQLALIELLEMEYVKLPLAQASLIALVQQERGRRRNASSAIALIGEEVV